MALLELTTTEIAATPAVAKPLVSVVIPTCHRNDLLARCLERLAPGAQACSSDVYEVIVTDDGSRSTSQAMVAERYPWAKWTAGPRKGPAANRNHGVAKASGEWIAFIDDDCLAGAGWLTAFLRAKEQDPGEVYEGRTTCAEGLKSILYEAPINLEGGCLWSCNMFIRRRTFETAGGFDEGFPHAAMEDVEFHERLQRLGYSARFVPEAEMDHPPRRRKLGAAAARQWEGRVFLEVLKGDQWRESLPTHVLKVRAIHLLRARFSVDWLIALGSMLVEVPVVAMSNRGWLRDARAKLLERNVV